MDEIVHRVMRFDRFVLDLTRGCVRSGDRNIELRPKTFEVLRHLVQNAGRLVPKEELFEALWPNVVVGDDSLVQCIRELRQKLGDNEHRLIKTVSRRGYVLDAALTPPERGDPPRSAPPIWDHLGRRFRKGPQMLAANLAALPERMRGMQWRAVAAAAGILVCASAAAIYLFSPASVPVKRTQLAGKDSVPSSPRPTFKDCNVCPEMVELPAGDFMMGSPESEYGRQPADGPQRHVAIAKRFAIGRLEVTVDQFEAFVADTGLAVENVCHKSVGVNQWAPAKGSFRQPGFDVTGSHPAVCVSWYDAQAYAAWLGRRTGRPYRLPSEAEWEYAARAGTTSAYSFGNDEGQLCEYARFGDLSSSFVFRGACRSEIVAFGAFPVGKLKPNPWGLFDMHGNAWEWVADCWISDVQKMPIDGMAFTRPGGCEVGVLRGGAWATGPRWVRSAHRIPIPVADRRYHVGFRVALSLGP